MFVGTDETGRVMYTADEQVMDDWAEVDAPEGWVTDRQGEYVLKNGELVHDPPELPQEAQAALWAQEVADALPDAIADLSEQVSGGAEDVAALMEAVAELSQLVSDLMEVGNG